MFSYFLYTRHNYIYTWRGFFFTPLPIPPAPLAVPLLLPFVPLSTYLAPSSCDRNRPPSSQVACKLTLFAPPFTQLFHPFQLPRTPTAQRLTTTTLGLLRSYYAEQFPYVLHIFLDTPRCFFRTFPFLNIFCSSVTSSSLILASLVLLHFNDKIVVEQFAYYLFYKYSM